MKLHLNLQISLISLCFGLLTTAKVDAKLTNKFTFTNIADTNGKYSSFSNFDSSASAPAINNIGTVAFSAELDAGGEGVWEHPSF